MGIGLNLTVLLTLTYSGPHISIVGGCRMGCFAGQMFFFFNFIFYFFAGQMLFSILFFYFFFRSNAFFNYFFYFFCRSNADCIWMDKMLECDRYRFGWNVRSGGDERNPWESPLQFFIRKKFKTTNPLHLIIFTHTEVGLNI